MGKTNISWCDMTFNPWIGCQKASAGCKFCYAERDFSRKPMWANCWGAPQASERKRTSEANWKKPLQWNREAESEHKMPLVFTASLADVFEDAPIIAPWRQDLFKLITDTPNLIWLLLTKRIENVGKFAPWNWPRNACLGFTSENQEMFDRRAPVALELRYTHRIPMLFVSVEPMLGPIDMTRLQVGGLKWDTLRGHQYDIQDAGSSRNWQAGAAKIDWVIAGGESGSDRPTHTAWVRSLRDQCIEAETPFHFKHWGEHLDVDAAIEMGLLSTYENKYHPYTYLDGHPFVRVGRKAAGCLIDGKEWKQFPCGRGAEVEA